MSTSSIVFVAGGIRLSTVLVAVVFAVLAIARRSWRIELAALAWVSGFEAAWQLTSVVMGTNEWPQTAFFMALPGVFFPVWAHKAGVRFDWRWLLLVALLWFVWAVVYGFHSNAHGQAHVNVGLEAVNELAKTAWAFCYLWPLLRWRGRVTEEPRAVTVS